ncbi:MAG: DoxX family protein [Candidatus Poseidoniales archaeon]
MTGVMEIAGGIGIIYPGTRVVSGRLVAIFLIAVFPANLYMWTHDVAFNGTKLTTVQHILRSFIQIVLILMALFLSGDLSIP